MHYVKSVPSRGDCGEGLNHFNRGLRSLASEGFFSATKETAVASEPPPAVLYSTGLEP